MNPAFNLTGQAALITGGGIGLGLIRTWAAKFITGVVLSVDGGVSIGI